MESAHSQLPHCDSTGKRVLMLNLWKKLEMKSDSVRV